MSVCLVLFSLLTVISMIVLLFEITILSKLHHLSSFQELLIFLPGLSIELIILLCSVYHYKLIFLIALPSVISAFVGATQNIYTGFFLFPSIHIASWVTVVFMIVNIAGLYFWFMDYRKNGTALKTRESKPI